MYVVGQGEWGWVQLSKPCPSYRASLTVKPREYLCVASNHPFFTETMPETPDSNRRIWQPLHPAIRDKLDPQYVDYHEKYLQYIVPDELQDWDGSVRTKGSLPPGGTQPVPVGSIEDFDVGRFRVRAYTPTGESDERGWPVLVWHHGGGWVVGGLNSGKDLCSWVCEGIYLSNYLSCGPSNSRGEIWTDQSRCAVRRHQRGLRPCP